MPERLGRAAALLKRMPLPVIILLIGALARIIAWGTLPPGLNQDEASIGYEAFALAHYGIDRNGEWLPIHLIAWGSGQNALYAYLTVPFIWLFGLNVYSIRIVGLLLGIAGMFALYWIARRMFPSGKGALFAALLVAVSPWQFMMSRWALESNAFPALVLLAFAFLLKGLEKPRYLVGFTILMAMSLYAYGTAYFFVPVFTVAAAILLWRFGKLRPVILLGHSGLMTLLSLPILLFVIINRYDISAIRTPFFTIPKLTVPRVEQTSAVFDGNMLAGLWDRFSVFLDIMLTGNDGLLWNGVPGFGYLYPISLPFIAVGIVYAGYEGFKRRQPVYALLVVWFAAAVLMSLITDVNINRINIVFYPIILFAACGLVWLHKLNKLAAATAASAFVIYFAIFSYYYYTEFPKRIGPAFFESFDQAIHHASDSTDGTIYVTNTVNMPYIYVLLHERVNPHDFVATVRYSNPGAPFQQVQSFGRFVFAQPQLRPGEHAAYIVRNDDPLLSNSEGYAVQRFKHYSVLSGSGDAQSSNMGFQNGGFENGSEGWLLSTGAGIGTNRPVAGERLLYLDPGTGITAQQKFLAERSGQYQLTAYTSAGGEGGTIQLLVNGQLRHEADIPMLESYSELALPAVSIQENDEVTLLITSGFGWINIDEVVWQRAD